MKKLSFIFILIITLCFSINVNAKTIELATTSVTINDTELVPMKKIFESLGYKINLNPEANIIEAVKDNINIKLEVGSTKIYKNDEEIILDTAPTLFNNDVYIPKQLIAEVLNYNIRATNTKDKLIISNELKVHYIDVGQAESIFIQAPSGINMLIDAGETKKGAIISFLRGLNIQRIDYILVSHPHPDHISEMDEIIDNFDIGSFYMAKVTDATEDFDNMIDALSRKNIKIVEAKAGVNINLGIGISCKILCPYNYNYGDNLNNWSAVVHLIYGNNSFLFTGDTEFESEKQLLLNNAELKSDILKIGHHGDRNATSEEFLDAVNPSLAIISAPENSVWGHPHKEVIDNLKERNIFYYCTGNSGTVTLTSDGKNIVVSISKKQITQKEDKQDSI